MTLTEWLSFISFLGFNHLFTSFYANDCFIFLSDCLSVCQFVCVTICLSFFKFQTTTGSFFQKLGNNDECCLLLWLFLLLFFCACPAFKHSATTTITVTATFISFYFITSDWLLFYLFLLFMCVWMVSFFYHIELKMFIKNWFEKLQKKKI